MKIFNIFFSFLAFALPIPYASSKKYNKNQYQLQNKCVTFYVSSGTGCAWMCDYCATNLGTDTYYFTDGVCTYEQGIGCVGNPIAGKSYTCCSA